MYELKITAQKYITLLLIKGIQIVNQHKDEHLSFILHDVADKYARRPTGEWNPND